MKTVLVTGASRGIGRAAARLFAQRQYNVAVNYRHSAEAAQALQDEIRQAGGQAMAVQADVSDEGQVREMCGAVLREYGGIDVLVNNAGIAWQGLLQDMPAEDWDTIFNINVRGAYLCSKYVLDGMISRKGGSIVNISSVWGIAGASCEVAYSASKAALIGFTKALAREVGPSGIRVNCVAPGVIETDMNAALDGQALDALRGECALGTLGTPADVARSIFFLCSEEAGYITGQVLSPNGGFLI